MPHPTGVQYQIELGYLTESEPTKYSVEQLKEGQMLLSIGPQHPSTHGVLRLEVITEAELVKEVVPHIGYLHRCFEKHCEALPFNQIIPYVDRLDYVAALNNEHIYAMAVEKVLGINQSLHPRVEYIRVLLAELNRIASHFVAIGTYGLDLGAYTPFLWMFRDREHILRLFEWVSGARLLYNYIWIGGLFYDLPIGFEERCSEFIQYLKPKLQESYELLLMNPIFIERTAKVGTLPLSTAISFGVTGPMLRASGLAFDLRRADAYSIYPELDFEIPIGKGEMGEKGDCWDRTYVRYQECLESIKIIDQCLKRLTTDLKRTAIFNPQAAVPKKIRPAAGEWYFRGETPRGELGFYFQTDGNSDKPLRLKARSACFSNLSVLSEICKGGLIPDLLATLGSIDFVMGEVDR